MANRSVALLKLLSFIGLGLSLIPSFLVFFGRLTVEQYKALLLIGTFLYLISAPFWINGKSELG